MSDGFYDTFFTKPEPERAQASTRTLDPARATRYAATALTAECAAVATTPNGHRNDRLNRAAFSIGQLVAAGHLDQNDAWAALRDAGHICGLDDTEIEPTLKSGFKAGADTPRVVPDLPDIPHVTVVELDPDVEDAFWDARPLLRHLHDYARARRVSPWAVLGVALARICTATPHHITIPPVVGGRSSLNLFVGLVGTSGSGKGAAEAVAAEAVNLGHIEVHTTGSGEGIAHGYMRREKGEVVQHNDAVLFSVPEIDTLGALGNRQGATLMPELRRGWSGESLGFAYADPAKRLPVPAHQYRLCLVAGIQPARASILLDDVDAGTPQRFLWLPAADTDAPDTPPPCPDPVTWEHPNMTKLRGPYGGADMGVCDLARDTIDAARLARLRGSGVALDGHGLLAQLKTACVLALADGRVDVTDDDWGLADVIARKSDATRGRVAATLSAKVAATNEARGRAEADRAVVKEEALEDNAVRRVAQRTKRELRKHGPMTKRELNHGTASRDRGFLSDALDRLTDIGDVVLDDDKYRLQEER